MTGSLRKLQGLGITYYCSPSSVFLEKNNLLTEHVNKINYLLLHVRMILYYTNALHYKYAVQSVA